MRSILVMLFGSVIVFAAVIATAQPPAGQRKPMNGNVPPAGGQRGDPGGNAPGAQAGGVAHGPGQQGPAGFGGQGGFGGQAGNAQMGQMTPMMMLGSLNLSNDQKQQITELQREFETRLGKILTPDQQRQLHDLQARGAAGAGFPGRGSGQGPGGGGPGGGGQRGGQGKRP